MSSPRQYVCIGLSVDDYEHLRPLKFCVDDVRTVGAMLKEFGGYRLKVLRGRTSSQLRREIADIIQTLRAGDVLVVFVALHGVLDQNDNQIFLLGGADRRPGREHFLTLAELRRLCGTIEDLDVVFLVDACRAPIDEVDPEVGAAGRRVQIEEATGEGERDGGARAARQKRVARIREVLACQDDQVAHEFEELQQGLFTRAFLNLMRERVLARAGVVLGAAFQADLAQEMQRICEEELGRNLQVEPKFVGSARDVVLIPAADAAAKKPSNAAPVATPDPAPAPIVEPKTMSGAPAVAGTQTKKAGAPLRFGEWRSVGDGLDDTPELVDSLAVLSFGLFKPMPIHMIRVNAGSFLMGSPESETGRLADEALRTVSITKVYWIAEAPVTQRLWLEVMGTRPWQGRPGVIEGDDVAASWIDWHGAVQFCRTLTDRERAAGRMPKGHAYRLPTEAEWEHAARGGTTTAWSFGDRESDLPQFAVHRGARMGEWAHRVKSRQPNPWGLYDMHGNVWEWCVDQIERGEVAARPADPTGVVDPVGTSGHLRVMRGGSWSNPAWQLRSAARGADDPARLSANLGFRPVIAAETQV